MSKRNFFNVFFVIFCAMTLICFVSCKDPEPEPDEWTKITSLDGLDGTWKGTISMKYGDASPNVPDNMKDVKISYEITFVFPVDVEDKNGETVEGVKQTVIMDYTQMIEATAPDAATADSIWESMKKSLTAGMGAGAENITCSDGKPYTITLEQTIPTENFIPDPESGEVYVNQHKNKLKTVAHIEDGLNSIENVPTEIIYYKQ